MRYYVISKRCSPKHKIYEVSGIGEMRLRIKQERNFYSRVSICGIRVATDGSIDIFSASEFDEPGNNAGDVPDGSGLEPARSEGCGEVAKADEVRHDRTNDGGAGTAGQSGYGDRIEPAKEAEETKPVYASAQDYCGL